jgi:chorismate dehydratase
MIGQDTNDTSSKFLNWKKTIGRVAFMNCDPLFLKLSNQWDVLPAPPSWLTGHLLRSDCILAPIPAADYARNSDELVLVPDLGICSKGEVGSVLLFGNGSISEMNTIALPSDSSSSVALLKYIAKQQGLEPNYIVMGPDIDAMLDNCDGALIIGDRALDASKLHPEKIVLDLGLEWREITGKPMVFGVFAARRDTPVADIKKAYNSLIEQLEMFENSVVRRNEIIQISSEKSGLTRERLNKYFGEVFNRLDQQHIDGLNLFLTEACGKTEFAEFLW